MIAKLEKSASDFSWSELRLRQRALNTGVTPLGMS